MNNTQPSLLGCLRLLLGGALLLVVVCPVLAQQQGQIDQIIDRLLTLAKEKKQLKAEKGDDDLKKLHIQLYNVALDELKQRCEDCQNGLAGVAPVFDAARHLLQAELDLKTRPEEKIKVLEKYLDITKWYENKLEAALKDNVGSRADLLRVRHARVSLEIQILKAKQ